MRVFAATFSIVVAFALGWAMGLAGPLKPQPLACYFVSRGDITPIAVTITTQFDTHAETIDRIHMLCLPADKKLPPEKKPKPVNKGDHLVVYEISNPSMTMRNVTATDQFGAHPLRLPSEAIVLLEPADKTPAPATPPGEEPKDGK